MKKYRLLISGRNFLINVDGKSKKHGFYQTVFLQANSPRQAELLAISKMWHDKELKEATLNTKNNPPVIQLETFWELDFFAQDTQLESERTFYVEKKWWQFWK